MKTDDILATILTNTYSLLQLKHRLRILKSNLLKTFFGNENSEVISPQDLNWLKSLPDNFYAQFNKNNVYQVFSDLEKKVESLPIVTLYLTFEPDEAALSQLGDFTRKLFSQMLLLDIKLDLNLIAGAAIAWKGVLKDYSLRAKIEERKTEILEGFRRFLR